MGRFDDVLLISSSSKNEDAEEKENKYSNF